MALTVEAVSRVPTQQQQEQHAAAPQQLGVATPPGDLARVELRRQASHGASTGQHTGHHGAFNKVPSVVRQVDRSIATVRLTRPVSPTATFSISPAMTAANSPGRCVAAGREAVARHPSWATPA